MTLDVFELGRARDVLRSSIELEASVALVYHADADGIASAALAAAALERAGGSVVPLTPEKGQNVYDERFRGALDGLRAGASLILDTGSRAGSSFGMAPSVVVDHHPSEGRPDAFAFVHDDDAAATTLLTFELVGPLASLEERRWLVALGILGDGGQLARSELSALGAARFGVHALREVVALLNASGRASKPAPEVALAALRRADDPRSIVRGETEAAQRLHALRREVAAAITRARRVPPRIRGRFAIIELDDACRIHGVIASAWARRLAPRIVMVANRGYREGRVHLAVRSHEPYDLRAELRALLPEAGPDYAAGHARATGAIIDTATYAALLDAIERAAARDPMVP